MIARGKRDSLLGDKVLANNFSTGPKWKKPHIENRTGPLSYTIKIEDGMVTRRHIDHILKRNDVPSREEDDLPESAVHAEQNPVPPMVVEEKRMRPQTPFPLTWRS